MSWGRSIRRHAELASIRPEITPGAVDWSRVVTVDFETYYDQDYTLKKMSTSEYIRDARFKAQMVGIKIGRKPTKVYTGKWIANALKTINWSTHSLLCHNAQFDGFILSHHYGIKPVEYYDTLSMARGLHSNEIGASLDEVAQFYGKGSKIEGVLETTKGVRDWSPQMVKAVTPYCAQDVDLTFGIFQEMHAVFPADELDLVDMTCQMFCDPVLEVDIPRVEAEYEREVERRQKLFFAAVNPQDYEPGGKLYDQKLHKDKLIKGPAERALEGVERQMHIVKRVIGNNELFAQLLRDEGIEPPVKVSPAWMKLSRQEKEDADEDSKWVYAFAKDDIKFTSIPDDIDSWRGPLDPNKKKDVPLISAKQDRLRSLVECRLAVKSTTNITRAERFLEAGRDGMKLPVGYAYYRAHTGRWGGANKMNMQNLTRGGELRLSILAPKGHQLCVVDSGQIEARVNAWLWGQQDLLDAFAKADKWDKSKGVARGTDRDAYCRFADDIYGFEVTTEDKTERFVGKVCLAADARVFTNRGLKFIVDVKSTDLLWDGESWVKHDGLIDQGIKEVIRHQGLAATADHEILTARGWRAWSEVRTDHSLFQSALSLATLPSCAGSTTFPATASRGATAPFVAARAAPKTWSTPTASKLAGLRAATHAPRLLQVQSGTGSTKTQWPTTSIAHAFSTGYLLPSLAVATRATRAGSITACEAFACTPNGWQTALRSCGMSRLWPDGMIRAASWTASTLTGAMSRATSGLRHALKTLQTSAASKISKPACESWKQRTRTYDLANAGPNHRFTVLTDAGPVIVHNCVLGLGFQMGGPKLQMTLAKGALGGPPVFFELDKCKDIVFKYRRRNSKIEGGWNICKRIIEDMAAGRPGRHGPIAWEKEKIWLPNGMSLKYPDLKKRVGDQGWDEWTYQAGDMRSKIYGGLLCENIVQALARIIVGWQMLQIRKKYRVVMTTHDEAVSLPKTREADKCFKFMTQVMSTPPSWCEDIPLNCEGGYAPNYSK